MRNFKKYFFESLLQLTILATVFRQNSRFSDNSRQFNDSTTHVTASEQNRTFGQLDLLFLNDNFNQFNETSHHLNNQYRHKELAIIHKDLKLLNILNTLQIQPNSNLILLPASFLNNTNNNQRNIVDLTETRLLLNSIELNLNNPTLKKEFEMDIELQTLIEQDIDFGVHKSNFYYMAQNSADNNESAGKFINPKNPDLSKSSNQTFNEFAGLEFKNLDILTTTKYIEDEKIPDDYKLFVEEDTGELFFVIYDQNDNKHDVLNDSGFDSSNETQKHSLSFGNKSIFDPIDISSNKTPDRPLFLSETSVCKTLNNLNEANDSNHNIVDSLLAFNDTLLNDFFNAPNESSTQDYQPVYEPLQQQAVPLIQNGPENQTNQTNMIGDQFLFEDQFLKDFEANLNKFELNELSQNQDQQSSIRNNQTIGAYSPIKSPLYVSEPINETEKLQETEPLMEQIYLNDLYKLFENPNNETNLIHNASNNSYPNAPQSFFMDSIKLNTVNDDEAKILNIFKQESIELDNESVAANSEHSRLISTINLPHLAQSEELTASIRGFQHNHTYLDGVNKSDDLEVFHPYSYKNKLKKMLKNIENDEANTVRQQESRDQLLLAENNINASLNHVVESNADEFNELIKDLQLNAEQLTIIKDIRRRGKNKVAAQICRKRKIDSIESLKEDVEQLNELKLVLDTEHDTIQDEIDEITKKFDDLYKELMGDNHEINDIMKAYMANLKTQLNKNKSKPKQSNLVRNLRNSDQSDSDEYESSNQSSARASSSPRPHDIYDDVIEVNINSKLNFDAKIKKFRKF